MKCPSKMLRMELVPLGPVAGHRPGGEKPLELFLCVVLNEGFPW